MSQADTETSFYFEFTQLLQLFKVILTIKCYLLNVIFFAKGKARVENIVN